MLPAGLATQEDAPLRRHKLRLAAAAAAAAARRQRRQKKIWEWSQVATIPFLLLLHQGLAKEAQLHVALKDGVKWLPFYFLS